MASICSGCTHTYVYGLHFDIKAEKDLPKVIVSLLLQIHDMKLNMVIQTRLIVSFFK